MSLSDRILAIASSPSAAVCTVMFMPANRWVSTCRLEGSSSTARMTNPPVPAGIAPAAVSPGPPGQPAPAAGRSAASECRGTAGLPGAAGSVKTIRVPAPGLDASTRIVPPISASSWRVMDSPRPVLSSLPGGRPFSNDSKIVSHWSSGMPIPVSSTSTRIRSPSLRADSVIVPRSVYLTALPIRL